MVKIVFLSIVELMFCWSFSISNSYSLYVFIEKTVVSRPTDRRSDSEPVDLPNDNDTDTNVISHDRKCYRWLEITLLITPEPTCNSVNCRPIAFSTHFG